MPKILIDARMVGMTPHGIARFVENIAWGLKSLGGLPYEPVFLLYGRGISEMEPWKSFKTHLARMPFLHPLESLDLVHILKKTKSSLYHATSFSSVFPALMPCPWVQTVHDLNHLQFGSWKEKLYYSYLLKPFYKKAVKKLTVSGTSRNEIASWMGIQPGEIEITWNALNPTPVPDFEVLKKWDLKPGRYFVCVSNSKPHKNLALLLRAFSKVRREDFRLVCTVTEKEMGPTPEGVVFTGALGERESSALRIQTRASIFPSLYEGFGLPPLEALQAGSPLLLSRIPSHVEALTEAGVKVDLEKRGSLKWVSPKDEEAWSKGLLEWMEKAAPSQDSSIKTRLESFFSRERLGESMDRIYRSVLKRSS